MIPEHLDHLVVGCSKARKPQTSTTSAAFHKMSKHVFVQRAGGFS